MSNGQLIETVTAQPKTIDGRAYAYRSGLVQSRPGDGKAGYLLRADTYVEARVLISTGDGLWPAFWAEGMSWPPELDIFEFFGTQTPKRPTFNYHRLDRSQSGPSKYGQAGTDYRNRWHTYGMLWTADGHVTPYLDGVAYPTKGASGVLPIPTFMLLSLGVQAGHAPPVGSQMRVDWVKVWRH